MSVIAGLAKAASGARVLTGTRPTMRVFPKPKWMLVVMALALLAIAALIPASQVPNTEHYSVKGKGTNSQSASPSPFFSISSAHRTVRTAPTTNAT